MTNEHRIQHLEAENTRLNDVNKRMHSILRHAEYLLQDHQGWTERVPSWNPSYRMTEKEMLINFFDKWECRLEFEY